MPHRLSNACRGRAVGPRPRRSHGGNGRCYSVCRVAGWSSQVARRAHNPEVAGSNPAPAMTEGPGNGAFSFSHPQRLGAISGKTSGCAPQHPKSVHRVGRAARRWGAPMSAGHPPATRPRPSHCDRRGGEGVGCSQHAGPRQHAATPTARLRDTRHDTTMHTSQVQPAVDAVVSSASELGLSVEDASVIQNSNRLALRLRPCGVLARVAPPVRRNHEVAAFEVEMARRLEEADCPIAVLEPRVQPRVHVRDGFAITYWTYYEPLPAAETAPAEYAQTLERLHAGMGSSMRLHHTSRIESKKRNRSSETVRRVRSSSTQIGNS